VIRRYDGALDRERGSAKRGPREKGGEAGGAEKVLPEEDSSEKNCGCGDADARARPRGIKSRSADSGREGYDNPHGGKLHGRWRSRVTASM
jgi:hypothetical protein